MDKSVFIKEFYKLAGMQRVLYLISGAYMMLLYVLDIEHQTTRTLIFLGVIFAFCLFDEIFLVRGNFYKSKLVSPWRYIQYVTCLLALYGAFAYPYFTVILLMFMVLYCLEFFLAGDISETYSYIWRLVFLFAPMIVLALVAMDKYAEYRWLYMIASVTFFLLVILRIIFLLRNTVADFEVQIKESRAFLDDMEDANHKLREYQDRVKDVNIALNTQKMDLERAYGQLNAANTEISVQADIANYFATTFEVSDILNYMMDTMISTKTLAFCGIYIDKDVYLNKHPNCLVKSESQAIKRRLTRDLPDYFHQYKSKTANVFIDNDVNANKYPFVGEEKIASLIIRPLAMGGRMYGIFMVGIEVGEFNAEKLVFYDAIIAQLNTTLNNVKLHLQTLEMAQKDGLTGIYNRTHFTQLFNRLIKETIETKGTICVALFDIDKFKRVNDTYGHHAGDEVIKTVARITNEQIQKNDGFACRYGGEEFVAVLPNKKVAQALPIIEEMHAMIADSVVDYGGERIGMNVSIGLTEYPSLCENPFDLLKRADWAMYYAKEHGRGQVKVDGPDVQAVN